VGRELPPSQSAARRKFSYGSLIAAGVGCRKRTSRTSARGAGSDGALLAHADATKELFIRVGEIDAIVADAQAQRIGKQQRVVVGVVPALSRGARELWFKRK
jgi:hypothetical protein